MTVRKGEAWGTTGALPPDGVEVHSDAEARELVESCRRDSEPIPALGLLGGDLCRTFGGRGDEERLHSPDAHIAPVDLGSVLVDGKLHWFVAHLVVRRSWWRGRVFVAMNAEFIDDWDVAPRSHPNDGRLDILEVDVALPFGDRMKAWRRLPAGTHIPHPAIKQRQVDAIQVEFATPTPVWLDGVRLPEAARQLSVRIEPDALVCVV